MLIDNTVLKYMLDNVRTINRVYSRVLICNERISYISIDSRDNFLQICYQEDLWTYSNVQDPMLCSIIGGFTDPIICDFS